MSERIINDIVHGIIELPDYIKVIIDTDQFQRLRFISQLGLDSFVYPSAGYSRFEHSIGTFHLASKLIKQIKEQLDKDRAGIEVSDDDIKCVEIAALCHDLGHGPYSHFWEQAFDEGIPTRKHEELSAEIFEQLMKNEEIKDKIGFKDDEKYKIKDKIDLIARIISGNIKTKDKEKYFLFEIVANKISGLDVDKFDYLCRDSIYLGWSNKNKIYDIRRIMHFLRVVKDEKNEWHLAMRDREIFNIHDVFYYRHLLHRYGYQHKTVKAIECLFKKAIKEIVDNKEHRDEFIKNVLNEAYNTNLDDPNIWFSTKFISKVCDHHVWEIMKKYTKDVVTQIQERNLIKIHCQIQVFRKENSHIKSIIKGGIESLREKVQKILNFVSNNDKNKIFSENINNLEVKSEEINDIDNSIGGLVKELKERSDELDDNSTSEPVKELKERLDELNDNSISEPVKDLIEKINELDVISKNISLPANKLNDKLKDLTGSLDNIFKSEKSVIEKLEQMDNMDDSTCKSLTDTSEILDQLNNIRQFISTIPKDFIEKSSKIKDIENIICKISKDLSVKLEGKDEIYNPINKLVTDIIEKINKLSEIVKPVSSPEYITSILVKLEDLPNFLIENGNIAKDLKSLTDILKQINGVADVAISKFSLQSEDKGNPLLAVRFYKKNDNFNMNKYKYFNMKEEFLPDLVKLKRDEFIIMIFRNKDKDISDLDEMIRELCSEHIKENSFDSLEIKENKSKLKDLHEKYKFRKNLY